jgi:hypothetical protein
MTTVDLELVKRVLKRLHEETKEVWLERVLLRNLIIDSGWMPERELDEGLASAKIHPNNVRLADKAWADSEQKLAEVGLADWLEDLDK